MTYDDFIKAVAKRAGVSPEQATTIAYATLETLADRISGGEAADLADQLPDRLADHVQKSPVREYAEPFELDEFIRRVSARAGIDAKMAETGARAVLTTVREAVPGYEFGDMIAQLPKDFWKVIEPVSGPGGSQ
jgi:uncharacterized protein (DUF2267 family)